MVGSEKDPALPPSLVRVETFSRTTGTSATEKHGDYIPGKPDH